MKHVTGKQLSCGLRSMADGVKKRLWISSPFVGGWSAVQCLIGVAWRNSPDIDVRLLTDIENVGALNPATCKQIETHGQVKHLRGLHAKIFIVDDSVLVTSANLTHTAFSKRYEVGVFLKGAEAVPVIKNFDDWWEDVAEFPPDRWIAKLKRQKHKSSDEESHTVVLKLLNPLPSPPRGISSGRATFGDYSAFVGCYKEFGAIYTASQRRIWPSDPLYFEIDAFLNFLYHDAVDKPSNPFKVKPPRNLSNQKRLMELKKYKVAFAHWVEIDPRAEKWRKNRLARWKTARRLLGRKEIGGITPQEIQEVVNGFHCLNVHKINKTAFLDAAQKNASTIRKLWTGVLYPDGKPLELAMRRCVNELPGFGKSSVQELLGWFDPQRYPLRNLDSNAGLRFFGYNVSAR